MFTKNTNMKKKMVKKGGKGWACVGALVMLGAVSVGATTVSADEWVANTPESIQIKEGQTSYTMVEGDTLWAIATKININVDTLAKVNDVDLAKGDQYNMEIGTVISWKDGILTSSVTSDKTGAEAKGTDNAITLKDENKVVADKDFGANVSKDVEQGKVTAENIIGGTQNKPTEKPVVEGTEKPVVEGTEKPVVEDTETPVTPEVPTEDEKPVVEDTEKPVNPEVPTEDEKPVVEDTETPEVPETPVTPEVPVNPETPVTPEVPVTPETPEQGTEVKGVQVYFVDEEGLVFEDLSYVAEVEFDKATQLGTVNVVVPQGYEVVSGELSKQVAFGESVTVVIRATEVVETPEVPETPVTPPVETPETPEVPETPETPEAVYTDVTVMYTDVDTYEMVSSNVVTVELDGNGFATVNATAPNGYDLVGDTSATVSATNNSVVFSVKKQAPAVVTVSVPVIYNLVDDNGTFVKTLETTYREANVGESITVTAPANVQGKEIVGSTTQTVVANEGTQIVFNYTTPIVLLPVPNVAIPTKPSEVVRGEYNGQHFDGLGNSGMTFKSDYDANAWASPTASNEGRKGWATWEVRMAGTNEIRWTVDWN